MIEEKIRNPIKHEESGAADSLFGVARGSAKASLDDIQAGDDSRMLTTNLTGPVPAASIRVR